MFAGLPGIGVGTLFYVLTALWMPVRECVRLVKGESSVERWRLIGVQFCFAVTIIASVALADRVLLTILGTDAPESVNPARLLNQELALRVPQSILAAPITASLILLAAVLLTIELMGWLRVRSQRQREQTVPAPAGLPTRSVMLSFSDGERDLGSTTSANKSESLPAPVPSPELT
jgi:hypothetical protein